MKVPGSVEEIFMNFAFRRYAIINALTWTFDSFHAACDPEKEELCLYGYPNGKWEVKAPPKQVPDPVPQPVSGINRNRDTSNREKWISYVATCSDVWLLSLAFYFAALARLKKREKSKLFGKINELKTINEVMRDRKAKEKLERETVNEEEDKENIEDESDDEGDKRKRRKLVIKETDKKYIEHESEEEDKSDEEEELCGKCGEGELFDDDWVQCDECLDWFHGKCGKMRRQKKKMKCIGCRRNGKQS